MKVIQLRPKLQLAQSHPPPQKESRTVRQRLDAVIDEAAKREQGMYSYDEYEEFVGMVEFLLEQYGGKHD